MRRRSVAVVGAGVAGLGAAGALAEADVDFVVLEAADRVGGRVVTRRREGYRYDTGANYLTPADGRMAAFLDERDPPGLAQIDAPVWVHDGSGEVAPGDPDRQDDHRWTFETGLDAFPGLLADPIADRIRTGTPVSGLGRRAGGWELTGESGEPLLRADAVVLTPPAPRAAEMLSGPDGEAAVPDLASALDDVPYRPVVTAVLGYPFVLDRPFYALVNPDRGHDVGWLSREEEKPGHVPDGESVVIVQLSPAWSATHLDAPDEEVAAAAAGLAADLLDDERLREPGFTDVDRFPVALPDAGIPPEVVEAAAEADLYLAGDGVVGQGRVSHAFFDGVDTGHRIAREL